jgi:hypothetical protein
MDKEVFQQWLIEKKGLAGKAASDAASRCRRIEAILGQKLEKAAVSQASFDSALTAIWKALPHRGDLMYSMRLYVTFRNPKIDTKKHAFYGQSSEMRKRFSRAS